MDMTSWGWPQYTILVLMFINILLQSVNHGEGMNLKYNGFVGICRFMLWTFLLYCGGFFR